MIFNNRRITIRGIADNIGMSLSNFTDVLTMKRAAAKIVSKSLNFEQKQRHMDIAQEILTTFKKAITGDESWVYGYDIEIKDLSSQWKRPEVPRPEKHFKFG